MKREKIFHFGSQIVRQSIRTKQITRQEIISKYATDHLPAYQCIATVKQALRQHNKNKHIDP